MLVEIKLLIRKVKMKVIYLYAKTILFLHQVHFPIKDSIFNKNMNFTIKLSCYCKHRDDIFIL